MSIMMLLKENNFMKYIVTILALLTFSCSSNSHKNDTGSSIAKIDSMSFDSFMQQYSNVFICNDMDTIYPEMVGWAQDSLDIYAEAYNINGLLLKIYQPLKIDTFSYFENRIYFYGGERLKTVRVIRDSIDFFDFNLEKPIIEKIAIEPFYFDSIFIDYGYSSENVYQKGEFITLINAPSDWCGLANQYRFVQFFDLKNMVCYELFINYYLVCSIYPFDNNKKSEPD